MKVKNILNVKGSDVVSVAPIDTVAVAAQLLTEKKIGAVMVMDNGGVVGILSERDMARGLAEHGSQVAEKTVASLMTANVVSCSLEDSTSGLMALMTQRRIRHLPVIENGQLAGMISIGDVVKSRIDEMATEVASLRGYVADGYSA